MSKTKLIEIGSTLSSFDLSMIMKAYKVSKTSKSKTKIGCIIIDKYGNILSTGVNRMPDGIEYYDHDLVIHAEMDAALSCDMTRAHAVYVYGLEPCTNCLKHLINRVSEIKYIRYKQHQPSCDYWHKNHLLV